MPNSKNENARIVYRKFETCITYGRKLRPLLSLMGQNVSEAKLFSLKKKDSPFLREALKHGVSILQMYIYWLCKFHIFRA